MMIMCLGSTKKTSRGGHQYLPKPEMNVHFDVQLNNICAEKRMTLDSATTKTQKT